MRLSFYFYFKGVWQSAHSQRAHQENQVVRRPGGGHAWKVLRENINSHKHQASEKHKLEQVVGHHVLSIKQWTQRGEAWWSGFLASPRAAGVSDRLLLTASLSGLRSTWSWRAIKRSRHGCRCYCILQKHHFGRRQTQTQDIHFQSRSVSLSTAVLSVLTESIHLSTQLLVGRSYRWVFPSPVD